MLHYMFRILLASFLIKWNCVFISAKYVVPTLLKNVTNTELESYLRRTRSSHNAEFEQIRSTRGTYGVPIGPVLSSYGVPKASEENAYGVPQVTSTQYGEPSKSYGAAKMGYTGKTNFGGSIKLGLIDTFKALKAGIFGLKGKVIQTTADILQKKSDALLEFANAKDHFIERTNTYGKSKPMMYGPPPLDHTPYSYGVPSLGTNAAPHQSYGVQNQEPNLSPPKSYDVPNQTPAYSPPRSYGEPNQVLEFSPAKPFSNHVPDFPPQKSYGLPNQIPGFSPPQAYGLPQVSDYSDYNKKQQVPEHPLRPQSYGLPQVSDYSDYNKKQQVPEQPLRPQSYGLPPVSDYSDYNKNQPEFYTNTIRPIPQVQASRPEGTHTTSNQLLQSYEASKIPENFRSEIPKVSKYEHLSSNGNYLEPKNPTNHRHSSENSDYQDFRKNQFHHQTKPEYRSLQNYNNILDIPKANVPLTAYSMYVANASPSRTTNFTDSKNNKGSIYYWSNVQLGHSETNDKIKTTKRRKKLQRTITTASTLQASQADATTHVLEETPSLKRKRRKNVNKVGSTIMPKSGEYNLKESRFQKHYNFTAEETPDEPTGSVPSDEVINSRSSLNKEIAREFYITNTNLQEIDDGSIPSQKENNIDIASKSDNGTPLDLPAEIL